MKLLPSSSCSSSSSFSSSTFDANSCNPRAATPGCLAGILRRILCSGSIPTHPSDQNVEEAISVKSDDQVLKSKDGIGKARIEDKPTTGIVARLMGLDSLPEMNVNPSFLSRSQSMNSVGHFHKHLEGKHRRVRSTVSLKEMPNFIELENEDFFILSFEGEGGSEMGFAEFKHRREENCKIRGIDMSERQKKKKKKKKRIHLEETKEYVLIDLREKKTKSNKPIQTIGKIRRTPSVLSKDCHGNLQVGPVEERVNNYRNSKKEVESECSSDDLSPVSVLDSSQFLRDPEVPLSGENLTSPRHRRRKLSPELENLQNPSSRNDDNSEINEQKLAKTKVGGFGIERDKWEEEICRITGIELDKTNWKFSGIFTRGEEFEGFDSYIIDELVDEFVEQMFDGLI